MTALLIYGVTLFTHDAPVLKESSVFYRRHIPCLPQAQTLQVILGMLFVNAASVLLKAPSSCSKFFIVLVLFTNMAMQGMEMPSFSNAANFEAKLTGGRMIALVGATLLL